jgi:hypothetical protein
MIPRKLIIRGLISGKAKLTPQVLTELDKRCSREGPPTSGNTRPPPRKGPPPAAPDSGSKADQCCPTPRLIFVSPLPGRWIRCTGAMLGGAVLLLSALARAGDGSPAFDAANQAFAAGRFAEAARGFEGVLAKQGWSAPVLFNLANAQQQEGRLGLAILNYERAALLAPSDRDIAANLNIARQKAGGQTERTASLHNAIRLLPLNGWVCLAATAVLVLAACIPLRRLLQRARLALGLGAVAAAVVLAGAITALALRWPELDRAVVIAPDAVAGVSPVTIARPLFKLRAGEVVTLKRTHGAFALIQNHVGHEGWVKTSDVAGIIPSRGISRPFFACRAGSAPAQLS